MDNYLALTHYCAIGAEGLHFAHSSVKSRHRLENREHRFVWLVYYWQQLFIWYNYSGLQTKPHPLEANLAWLWAWCSTLIMQMLSLTQDHQLIVQRWVVILLCGIFVPNALNSCFSEQSSLLLLFVLRKVHSGKLQINDYDRPHHLFTIGNIFPRILGREVRVAAISGWFHSRGCCVAL